MRQMRQKITEILTERNIDSKNFLMDDLYKAGMENVKEHIEFYYDKTYTCESVITELFIRGISDYIKNK